LALADIAAGISLRCCYGLEVDLPPLQQVERWRRTQPHLEAYRITSWSRSASCLAGWTTGITRMPALTGPDNSVFVLML